MTADHSLVSQPVDVDTDTCGVLYVIASGQAGFDVSAGFASSGYGTHSPGGYSLLAALITEVVITMMFLLIILGATDKRAPQ